MNYQFPNISIVIDKDGKYPKNLILLSPIMITYSNKIVQFVIFYDTNTIGDLRETLHLGTCVAKVKLS